MKRVLLLTAVLLAAAFLTGCIRTTTYVKERVDQELRGNRGYIQGNIPASVEQSKASRTRTRTIMQVEIELPPYGEARGNETQDKKIWGNKGVVSE